MPSPAIRLADDQERAAAQALLNSRFADHGFGDDHPIPSDGSTFVAVLGGEVIATVTLLLEGARARLVRLASKARSEGVLWELFQAAYKHGRRVGRATELLIETRPAHARKYVRLFGFTPVGAPEWKADVGSLSQVLRIDVEALQPRPRQASAPATHSTHC